MTLFFAGIRCWHRYCPICINKVMKKLFVLMVTSLVISVSFGQMQYPNTQGTFIRNIYENENSKYLYVFAHQLDSNEQYKYIRDGYVKQGGQLKLVRNGNLYPQDSPVILKNGSILMTDGLIKMTNGSTPLLRERDFIDMDGNIRPLQRQLNNF